MTIRVLNALSAPVSLSNIDILVFVRAAENLEFANPVNLPLFSTFAPQAQDEYVENGKLTVSTSNITPRDDENRYLTNFGESVKSLRQILRRSTLQGANIIQRQNGTGINLNRQAQTKIPLSYGYDPNGANTALSLVAGPTAPFNFVQVTPFTWIAPMFIGYRGSMIWHYNLDSSSTRAFSTVRVRRLRGPIDPAIRNSNSLLSVLTQNNLSRDRIARTSTTSDDGFSSACFGGVAQTNQNTQAGLSILAPMYNRYRFAFSIPTNANLGVSTDDTDRDLLMSEIMFYNTQTDASYNVHQLEKFSSIGTDFTFFFFLNCPTLYDYGSIPNPP